MINLCEIKEGWKIFKKEDLEHETILYLDHKK